ncbi:hypothetical protein VFPFJ_01266 [Purpureocillium lilacinum]|uniref:Uncharacterized protein n=1 Tax=Purpureocillium lilacinum TaxID=33203 RepID=A0A179HAN4_PURLI|nr:hypothetical protein VFPFJ_01266 [Purpureocillium lilacinum]OAQ87204.1 hypothetical protein VFPBJ_01244 [Purpureocillium lilacinum]OAQ95157.1 hypothetical protein VFPFJ_01266 [Purpureocillium lilacinum]
MGSTCTNAPPPALGTSLTSLQVLGVFAPRGRPANRPLPAHTPLKTQPKATTYLRGRR